ncbi:MAG: glycosyltransferase [Microgenomates group bacterium]
MKENLTVLIITKNAQATLSKTLDSVKGLTSHILIVDDYSTDDTARIAYTYGAEVVARSSSGFADQRSYALTLVKTDWVLILDSDEVLTGSNIIEIRTAVLSDKYNGYRLRFRNHLFGKKLNNGELHKKLVLFQTKRGIVEQKNVHETYVVSGSIGELSSEVIHDSYRTPLQVIKKFIKYAVLQAVDYKKSEIKWGMRELFLNPPHMFYARCIKDEGYKDGLSRVFLDSAFAGMEFLSYFLIPFVKIKKSIAVDCGSYPVGGMVQSGIDRLIQGLYSNRSDDFIYFWFGFHPKAQDRLPTVFFSQLWLPLVTIIKGANIFLGVSGVIPRMLHYSKVKKILFLYDFGFLKSPELYVGSAMRLKRQTEDSIRYADKIVFLHEELHKEFILRYPHFSYKAVVIPSGADHLQNIQEVPVFIQPKKPVYLSVGVVKPIKKIETLLSVISDTYTIIAGSEEKEYADILNLNNLKNVQRIQKFNDGQLKWLYTHSDILINTSENEGFCYPVLEALTLGLPVVAFDLPLFQEYKKYFSHLTLVSSKEEMKEILNNNSFHKNSKPIVHPYHWNIFAQSLVNVANKPRRFAGTARKTAIIVVLYKTPQEEINRLEKEIHKMKMSDYSIYWIDNSKNGKGYAAGINEGILKGLIDGCTLFMAMNPDISLEKLSSTDVDQAAQKFDVWGYAMRQEKKAYYGGEIDKWRLSGGLIDKKPKSRYAIVDFISASIICFTKEVVQEVGLWDESYFMYYEDVDYCLRAKKHGYRVGIDSEVFYTHFEVSQLNQKKNDWIAKSRWRFFLKYADIKQRIRELIRLPKTLLGK